MNTKFHLFRLSLREREQGDLFVDVDMKTREEWIRALFQTETNFTHYGTLYTYIPVYLKYRTDYLYGKIGREKIEIESLPPEDGLKTYTRETWQSSAIVIDPTPHSDGQKVALQFNSDVGDPSALAPRLIKALEERQKLIHYLTSINPITDSQEFWDFVKKNRDSITSIRVELEVPNMFGADDEYDKEMKQYKEKENAQRVAIEIKNPDGVNAESERVKYTVDKAMNQGRGSITARARGKRKFKSSAKQVISEVPHYVSLEELDVNDPSDTNLKSILGRE